MARKFLLIFFAGVAVLPIAGIHAQSPAPALVLTQTAPTTTAPTAAAPSESAEATIKLLQEIKAANEETLKKQQAALDTLDELQKEAEQIKIFSKRS